MRLPRLLTLAAAGLMLFAACQKRPIRQVEEDPALSQPPGEIPTELAEAREEAVEVEAVETVEARPGALSGSRHLNPPEFVEIDPVRAGLAYWDSPPEVISAYDRDWFDYRTIFWMSPPGDAGERETYFRRMREMNAHAGMRASQGPPDPYVDEGMPYYRTNICNLLYISNKSFQTKKKDLREHPRSFSALHRDPSLEDPETLENERSNARSVGKMDAEAGKVIAYDFRDEATYTVAASPFEFDFSPVSLASFRVWLKTQYEDLDALNEQWETAFESWDVVMPFRIADLMEREWTKPDMSTVNLSPWADHRAYNDYIWFKTLAMYRDDVYASDPRAPIGYSGIQMPSAWGGFNYDQFGRELNWCEYYDICGNREVIRGLSQENAVFLAVTPYENTQANALRIWDQILKGDIGGIVWPFGSGMKVRVWDPAVEGWPLTREGENLASNLRETRGGHAPLLRKSHILNDGIAILYHQPSIRADWPFEVKRDGKSYVNRFSSWESGHNYMAAQRVSLHKLLEDLGYQYTYVRPDDLQGDRLDRAGVKVLFLLRNVCLSEEEVEGLRAFVEGGGIVVSDLMPGRLDERGKVLSEDALARVNNLFGLERAPFKWMEETKPEDKSGYKGGYGYPVELSMKADFGPFRAGSVQMIQGFQEEGLRASGTARAYAETPNGAALVVAERGEGRAVTLNFDFPNYEKDRNKADGAEQIAAPRALLRHILADMAGIEPAVRVAEGGKGYPEGVRSYRYEDGANYYLALINNRSSLIDWETLADELEGEQAVYPPRAVSVGLPARMHVYDMLNRRELGLTDSFDGMLEPFRPAIFALRPYAVERLDAEVAKTLDEAGLLPVSLRLIGKDGAAVGNHVVNAVLTDAEGNEVPEGLVNLPLPGGVYRGAIGFALVPGDGPWTLRLRDVASDASATFKVARAAE